MGCCSCPTPSRMVVHVCMLSTPCVVCSCHQRGQGRWGQRVVLALDGAGWAVHAGPCLGARLPGLPRGERTPPPALRRTGSSGPRQLGCGVGSFAMLGGGRGRPRGQERGSEDESPVAHPISRSSLMAAASTPVWKLPIAPYPVPALASTGAVRSIVWPPKRAGGGG